MTSLIAVVCTFSLIFNKVLAQSNVTRGSSLTPNGATTSWLSPSRLYAFGFYPQRGGYAVGIYITGILERSVVWTADRNKLPLSNSAILRFTNDGRLIVDQTQSQQISIFDTGGAFFASMQDSGNFVLYDIQGKTVLWQSFDYPTETLLVGQRLVPPRALFSSISDADQSIGVFQLMMQTDGHLVQYPNVGTDTDITPSKSYWASGTVGTGPNVTLNLDSDGFLYLLQNSTIFIRNLTQGGYPRKDAIYRMKIDVDGIFRLYYHDLSNTSKNGSVIWASSANKCVGRGLCGVNGYCFVMNNTAHCQCMPGFEFVDPELHLLGCHRNFSIASCKMSNTNATFVMTELNNARWEEATYAIPEASTLEECSSACLRDCNCEAALFIAQKCRFQRLPLRYIEIIESVSNVGLFKVYTSSGSTNRRRVHDKKVRQQEIIIISVSLTSFVAAILLISVVVMRKAQVRAYKKISKNLNHQVFKDIGPQAFSYSELERITNGFKEEIGRGSFGIVYKGIIESSKKMVAVKKLNQELAQEAGEREFQTEMKVIGRTHHRNLARLLGYCSEGLERLLVFEYMSKGSLADILFEPKESKRKPCWKERITMAVDIAHGILYLHEYCETAIIHCDIKPQNILMDDESQCAKISDFGLAKLLEHDQTRTSTLIRGTRGYVAPEWHKNLPITVKVDVYSFGILLFNIICCRRNVDNKLPDHEVILEEWVYACYEADELKKLISYNDDVDNSTLDQMIKIGLWCVQEDPSHRPSMKKVLSMLEGIIKVPVPPTPSSFLSVF